MNVNQEKNTVNEVNEDVDEVLNDSDTSTSFSLEECMNEFRARRRRRNLSHRKDNENNGTTEMDLINQNLSNKEQERKCKPCENGFCYCFTSDSGDGGGHTNECNISKLTAGRNFRRTKKLEYDDFTSAGTEKKNVINFGPITINDNNDTITSTNQLTAISTIETSKRDAPLIHITQELRNNCVISKISVNKHKTQPFKYAKEKVISITERNESTKGKSKSSDVNFNDHRFLRFGYTKNTSTAQYLENAMDSTTFKKTSKCFKCHERPCKLGGHLLHKRLSNFNFNYRFRNFKHQPTKPPRSSLSYNDKYSGTIASTSSSVREAEGVLDDFLKKKGFNITTIKDSNSIICREHRMSTKNVHSIKRKSFPLISKDMLQTENIALKYPSLIQMEKVIEPKKFELCNKNISPLVVKNLKEMSIDWKEDAVNHMLNYDANSKQNAFNSAAAQAEPQQRSNYNVLGIEKSMGWKIPENLDTVDGIISHNLASNLENKNTPIKSKLISSPKNDSKPTGKFLWSEKFRQLSPWSMKCNNVSDNSTSNKCFTSKAFIKRSKKKLLKLVSPKKENKSYKQVKSCKTPYHHVAVQTSCDDMSSHKFYIKNYNSSSSPQSPPGSYHSPLKSSHNQFSAQSKNSNQNSTDPNITDFDFSRKVHSPPKKAFRNSQRKLHFPLNRTYAHKEGSLQNEEVLFKKSPNEKKTYHSFNIELDNHVSISRMSYILGNIRARLEATDEQAVRTFLENECIADYPLPRNQEIHFNDTIYSEIEDTSVHIVESSNIDNNCGIQQTIAADDPLSLYAKVNKCRKSTSGSNMLQFNEQNLNIPLAKIMQDSLKSKKIITNITPLPPLPEPPESEIASYSLQKSQCQSLNNVRVMEHNTMPKYQRNLSKSELSLNSGKIFMENLYRSELVLNVNIDKKHSEKEQNDKKEKNNYLVHSTPNKGPCENINLRHSDAVSYELPNDVDDYIADGSSFGLSNTVPSSSFKQSTPKKKSFMAKDKSNRCELNDIQVYISNNSLSSCRNIPRQPEDKVHVEQQQYTPSDSLYTNEMSEHMGMKNSCERIMNTLERCKSLQKVLRKSFRKSKNFIKEEFLNFSINNASTNFEQCTDSTLHIENLFSLDEDASVSEQITEAVTLCRKLPDLEVSAAMVEAERLLLFSTLRSENQYATSSTRRQSMNKKIKFGFFIDELFLPVNFDVNQDIYFNYFYIVTFECKGVIKSTQSAECVNGTATFRDCCIEFAFFSETDTPMHNFGKQDGINCNIFMLRLRKISTFPIETRTKTTMGTLTRNPSSSLTSSSSSISTKVVSRFRLHSSFTLNARDFVPYKYVDQQSNISDWICLRSCCSCNIQLKHWTKYTNLSDQIRIKGRTEVRFPKNAFSGYLNVEDPHSKHYWNRRWCTLDGIFLNVWKDENSLNITPYMTFDLRDTKHNTNGRFTSLPRELCARPRSFYLEFIRCNVSTPVMFAAETQDSLEDWLKNLNFVLDFITTWLQ